MSNHIHNAIETLEKQIASLEKAIPKKPKPSGGGIGFLTSWFSKQTPMEQQRDYLQSIVTNLKQGHYNRAMRLLGHIQTDAGSFKGPVFRQAGRLGKHFFDSNQFSKNEQRKFVEGYKIIQSARSTELQNQNTPKLVSGPHNPENAKGLITAYENIAVHTILLTQGLAMAHYTFTDAELGNDPQYQGALQLIKFTREPLDAAQDKQYYTEEEYDYGEDHLYPGEERRERIGTKDQAIRDFKRDVKINGNTFRNQEVYDKADDEQRKSMIPYDSKDKESKDIKKYILEKLCNKDDVLARYIKDLGGQHIAAFSWNEIMTSTHLSDGRNFFPAHFDTKHNITTTNPITTTEGSSSTEDAPTVFYDYYYDVYGLNVQAEDGNMLRFIKGEDGTLKKIPGKDFEQQKMLHEAGKPSIFDSCGPIFSTHTVFQMKHGEGDTIERKVIHHEKRVNVAGLEIRPPVLERREKEMEKTPDQESSSGDYTP